MRWKQRTETDDDVWLTSERQAVSSVIFRASPTSLHRCRLPSFIVWYHYISVKVTHVTHHPDAKYVAPLKVDTRCLFGNKVRLVAPKASLRVKVKAPSDSPHKVHMLSGVLLRHTLTPPRHQMDSLLTPFADNKRSDPEASIPIMSYITPRVKGPHGSWHDAPAGVRD